MTHPSPLKFGHGWVITNKRKLCCVITYPSDIQSRTCSSAGKHRCGNSALASLLRLPRLLHSLDILATGVWVRYDHHYVVIKCKHFPRYWPFVRGIHRSPVDSQTKASGAEIWCFLWYIHLNKRLNKQWSCWWFRTPCRSCDVTVMPWLRIGTWWQLQVSFSVCAQPMRDGVTM